MASPSLRFGLEIELHGVLLTFVDDDGNFCADAAPGIKSEEYMIGLKSILVPDVVEGVFMDANNKILWETNAWGFRAVADAPGKTSVRERGAYACILELATAAAQVDDHRYWINSRKHATKMVGIMNRWLDSKHQTPHNIVCEKTSEALETRWYPLQDFLDEYNSQVEQNSFRLKKSVDIIKFENGTHPHSPKRWHPHVSFRSVKGTDLREKDAARWADVQVNYQLNLSDLYNKTDFWVESWNSIWAQRVRTSGRDTKMDDVVGDTMPAVHAEFYKVQVYAAMWRLAKAKVDEQYSTGEKTGASKLVHKAVTGQIGQSTVRFPSFEVETQFKPHIRALLMYLIVTRSITNIKGGHNRVDKNFYPQLPKTSPASIRRVIEDLDATTKEHFKKLIKTGPVKAATGVVASLRNLPDLRLGGRLSDKNPREDLDTRNWPPYASDIGLNFTGGMVSGTIVPKSVEDMWKGGLDATNDSKMTAANNMGFTEEDPFYLSWASEVNSAYPATATKSNTDIRVLFESRYGRCLLNIGFNPYISDALFNRSYLRLVNMLCGQIPASVKTAVDAAFPDDLTLRQHLGKGTH